MDAYYYAGGRRIALEPDDDHVAVDQRAARHAGVDMRAAFGGTARPPVSGVLLGDRAALDKKTLASLRKAGALQPVFRRERAVLVALPEVRIEVEDAAQRQAVLDALARRGLPTHTVEETEDRIIVRPESGDGGDALRIANHVYELAHPGAASVRFVQFVPDPDVKR